MKKILSYTLVFALMLSIAPIITLSAAETPGVPILSFPAAGTFDGELIVSAVDFGLNYRADGITNRDALNAALNYVSDLGGGVVTIPAGTFEILDGKYTIENYPGDIAYDGTPLPNFPISGLDNIYYNSIMVPSSCTLRGAGRNVTTLRAVDNSNWYLVTSAGIAEGLITTGSAVENLTLDCNREGQIRYDHNWNLAANYAGGGQSGILFFSNEGRVQNVAVTDAVWNGIIMTISDQPTVKDCYVYSNGKAGIYFSDCTEIICTGNTVRDCVAEGLALAYVRGGVVNGNIFTDNKGAGINVARANKNLTITGNSCILNAGGGFLATQDAHEFIFTINNSVISGNDFSYAGRRTIDGSTSGAPGMLMYEAHDNFIANNKVSYSGGPGIILTNSSRNTITENKIYGPGKAPDGIMMPVDVIYDADLPDGYEIEFGPAYGICIVYDLELAGYVDFGIIGGTGTCEGNIVSFNDINDDAVGTNMYSAIFAGPMNTTNPYAVYANNDDVVNLTVLFNVIGNTTGPAVILPVDCNYINWEKPSNQLVGPGLAVR